MKKVKTFFRDVKKEAKSVKWPTGKTLLKYSLISIVMIVFFAAYFFGLDAIFTFIRGLF